MSRHALAEFLSVHEPAFAWILRHAVMLLNWRQVGWDGLTAWHRLTGQPYAGELLKFGATVLYRLQQPIQGGLCSARWLEGFWMGKCSTTDQHLVWPIDGRGVQACRSVCARPGTITHAAVQGISDRPREHGAGYAVRPDQLPEDAQE